MKKDFEFISDAIKNEHKCQNSEKNYADQDYVSPRIDNYETKHEIIEIAGKYLSNKEFHTSEKTDLLIKILLDIEIYPLRRELSTKENTPGGLFTSLFQTIKNGCSWPVRASLWAFKIGIFIAQLILIIFAFNEPNILTITISIISGLFLYKKFANNFIRTRKIEKLALILSEMTRIRDEINLKAYSPQRISEKLKQLESQGGHVYSVVHSLLALRNTNYSI